MIYSIYKDKIDKDILRKAIERTSKYRGSFEIVLQHKEIVELFWKSETSKELWKKYTQNNPYVRDIDFLDTISVYEGIGTVLNVNDDIKSLMVGVVFRAAADLFYLYNQAENL